MVSRKGHWYIAYRNFLSKKPDYVHSWPKAVGANQVRSREPILENHDSVLLSG